MGPPHGDARAPRVGPLSIVILARECTSTDWKQCHGSRGFHSDEDGFRTCQGAYKVLSENYLIVNGTGKLPGEETHPQEMYSLNAER